MKYIIFMMLLLSASMLKGQDVTGKWMTVDDETGKVKALVDIYKKGNKY